MNCKCCCGWILLGVGMTLLCQQIKNGNAKKFINNMKNGEVKVMDELESMM